MNTNIITILIVIVALGAVVLFLTRTEQFDLPKGEAVPLSTSEGQHESARQNITEQSENTETNSAIVNSGSSNTTEEPFVTLSSREIFVTDGVKHSILINEILSGGPGKDGIPSIDNPKFVSSAEANEFIPEDGIGLGLFYKGEARFYPYSILVWHELVNDVVAGDALLISYCPLCLTGIVFDRTLDGRVVEFGVSGRLWRSNLLMYNRTVNPDDESLWSQVLGEAVVGNFTGRKLSIILSDAVRYSDWKKEHPDTIVLSRDTGASRSYGRDPYGDYYTNSTVSFGASFNDDRLHPKDFVLGIEIDGKFKAYHIEALPEGTITDTFAGNFITVEKSGIGEVRMFIGDEKQPLSYIGGFWFSWLAVHPNTALFK